MEVTKISTQTEPIDKRNLGINTDQARFNFIGI